MASPRAWLMRHDPGLATVRRAARVTLVACAAFYLCRYVLDSVTMAPYAPWSSDRSMIVRNDLRHRRRARSRA